MSENPRPPADPPGRETAPAGGGLIDQILSDHAALRRPDTDPELEALRAAILLEDVFGVVLPDAEIDPAKLADGPAMATLLTRLRGIT